MVFPWLRNLTRRLARPAPKPSSRRAPRRPRLGLEALEDRIVPSTLFVDPSGMSGNHLAYKTIQAAVNAANPGDTVSVDPGTYNENVTINTTLRLLGAEHGVDARTFRTNESVVNGTIFVTTNDVVVDGFTVQNGQTAPGILVEPGVTDTRVLDNIVQQNTVGLDLNAAVNSIVRQNLFAGATQDILLENAATGNTVNDNTIQNAAYYGIDVTGASDSNQFSHDTVIANFGDGVFLTQSTGNAVQSSTISGNSSNVVLQSADGNLIAGNVLEFSTGNLFQIQTGPGWGVDLIQSSDNVVRGNTVDNNFLGGVKLTGSANGNLVVANQVFSNPMGIMVSTSTGNTFAQNQVYQNGDDGICLEQSDGNTLSGNTVTGNGGVNVDLEQSNANIVRGNTIANAAGDGIDVGDSDGNQILNNSVTGNGFGTPGSPNQGQGMLLSTNTNTLVAGNTVTGNHTSGIEVAITSSGITIQNNIVNNDGGLGIGVAASSGNTIAANSLSGSAIDIELLQANGNVVRGNTIANAWGDGLDVGDSDGNQILNNTVTGNGFGPPGGGGGQGQGMLLSTDTNTLVSGNSVVGNHTSGIDVAITSSGITIRNNTVNNDGGLGIGVAASSNCLIAGNSLSGSAIDMELLQANYNVVRGNIIANAWGDGLDVGDSDGNTIQNNTVTGNGFGPPGGGGGQGQGMLLSTDTNTLVAGNTVVGNNTSGIEVAVSSSHVNILDNTVNNDGGLGIGVAASSNCLIAGNSLSGSAIDMELLQANNNIVRGNIIANAWGDGLDVGDSDGNQILVNTITGNGFGPNGTGGQGQGMLLSTVTNTLVSGNQVNGNSTDGIEVAVGSSGVTIQYNTAQNNGGDGIGLGASTNCVVADNRLSGNLNNIELIQTTTTVISDNTAVNAVKDGIRLDATSTGNTVTNNTMSGNGLFDAEDDSSGSGTAGTANTWTGNQGTTDNHNGGLFQ